tara:strand:+ start:93 stop:431 length:339 start_codon:yes stop_codon:yes gene_type:complete
MIKKSEIIEILKTCFDPEIPIDFWNLGLIYNINISNKKKHIDITMTLTTPGCSMATHIANDVKNKILAMKVIKSVDVKITFEPIWKPEMMTEDGKIKLGFKPKKEEKEKDWE